MKHHALAAFLALAAIGCARPPAQESLAAQSRYVIVADNRTQSPVYVRYTPGPGGGSAFVVDIVGPAQRKTMPIPETKGAGGGSFSAQTLEGKPASNVSITIERVRTPAVRSGT